jgi:hypothetical protein
MENHHGTNSLLHAAQLNQISVKLKRNKVNKCTDNQ